jgi:hypothetical protein
MFSHAIFYKHQKLTYAACVFGAYLSLKQPGGKPNIAAPKSETGNSKQPR